MCVYSFFLFFLDFKCYEHSNKSIHTVECTEWINELKQIFLWKKRQSTFWIVWNLNRLHIFIHFTLPPASYQKRVSVWGPILTILILHMHSFPFIHIWVFISLSYFFFIYVTHSPSVLFTYLHIIFFIFPFYSSLIFLLDLEC